MEFPSINSAVYHYGVTFANYISSLTTDNKAAEYATDFFENNIKDNTYVSAGAILTGGLLLGKTVSNVWHNKGLTLKDIAITGFGAGILYVGIYNAANPNENVYANCGLAALGSLSGAALFRPDSSARKTQAPINSPTPNDPIDSQESELKGPYNG